jgi:hypothetical protein
MATLILAARVHKIGVLTKQKPTLKRLIIKVENIIELVIEYI